MQTAVSGRESSAPTDPLFVRWKSSWNEVQDAMNEDVLYCTFDWEKKAGTKQAEVATKVREWAMEANNNRNYSRGDYDTGLTYILLFLGCKVANTIKRPCNVSKARFLQVGLYYLQISLLRNVRVVTKMFDRKEWVEIEIMAEYSALHYLPTMLAAKYAPAAPRQLLTSIARLRAIRNEVPLVSMTALTTIERHLNFVSPELVVFSMFDEQVPDFERKKMAAKLLTYLDDWEPEERLICERSMPGPNFCTSNVFWRTGAPPCTCRYTCTCTSTGTCTCTSTGTCTCTGTCTSTCTPRHLRLYILLHLHLYLHPDIHLHLHLHLQVHV